MSYLDYPRLHFSGTFQASPSTINNTPNNYSPEIYSKPHELDLVELYWNPLGDGSFNFEECFVTKVEYANGSYATTPEEDSIIGKPVSSISNFPFPSAIVDLDPMQQNVSEVWGLNVQAGDASNGFTGVFQPTAFNAIWGQSQGPDSPRSSASGAGVFQALLNDVKISGNGSGSAFIKTLQENNTSDLSLNFVTNAHNNSPHIYRFTEGDKGTLSEMVSKGVPPETAAKLQPMTLLMQNVGNAKGDIPTKEFTKYLLQFYLTTEEYNKYFETIFDVSYRKDYKPSSTFAFSKGAVIGTVGPVKKGDSKYFIPSRMMAPYNENTLTYFAPFKVTSNGKSITLNLGNSLPVIYPGKGIYKEKLGDLYLVALSGGPERLDEALTLGVVDYKQDGFLNTQAGFSTFQISEDISSTPLGLMQELDGKKTLLLAENNEGYFMRADQFVYRMNPNVSDEERSDTATVNVHVYKFGQPVEDGCEIKVKKMNPEDALTYTAKTPGTSGTRGLENLSCPENALKFDEKIVKTVNSIATFTMRCTDPGNPREYVDGQIYFINYSFNDENIKYTQDVNDLISVHVYDAESNDSSMEILAKYGRIYKVMDWLTNIEDVDARKDNIRILLQKPFDNVKHMPVTRDLSIVRRNKIVSWINQQFED